MLEIALWIAKDNPEGARRFVEDLEARCAALIQFPERGRARPELASGLRSTPFGRYIIFYAPEPGELRIERILHGARDIAADFGQS